MARKKRGSKSKGRAISKGRRKSAPKVRLGRATKGGYRKTSAKSKPRGRRY